MELPILLAGPIIRRTEASQVYIWVAMSKRYRIKGEVFHISSINNDTDYQYDLISNHSETTTMRLGKQLYISLVRLLPIHETFPSNTLLGYNLQFKRGNETLDLQSFNLLSSDNPYSIVYGKLRYPSFYINGSEHSKLLYGSCRKAHGKGKDALPSADALLQQSYFDLELRPDSLFLMGDQIYADDVADPLIPFLSSLGNELTGPNYEDLNKLDSRLSLEPFRTSINQVHGRQFIMKNFCKFTSNNAYNHLMHLSEYASMYLVSWSPDLWKLFEEQLDSFEEFIQKNKLYFVYPDAKRFKKERIKELKEHRARYKEQLQEIRLFQQTTANVRRLLANVPTYMIFDDHDITDDWNISLTWKQEVEESPLGSHVISNGLTAYWAFQGWGNDPIAFNKDFIKTIWRYVKSLQVDSQTHKDWVQILKNYDTWHFVTPTTPKAIFLDTRTMRQFDPYPRPVKIGGIIEEAVNPPELISEEGWKKISTRLWESNWKKNDRIIIISPTPLYGIGLIESFLQHYVYPLKVLGIQVQNNFDFEAWKYNARGFNEFHNQILKWNPGNVFILSGDVHYASSVQSNIEFYNGTKSTIYQFTSSPLNNMSFNGVWGTLMKFATWVNSQKRKRQEIHRYYDQSSNLVLATQQSPCPPDFRWKEKIQYLPMDSGDIIETKNNLGFIYLTTNYVQNFLIKHDHTFNQIAYDTIHLLKTKISKTTLE